MRLICPNCDAQYEVPSEVIPEEGRDVQCSNCGQTWYQYHPDHIPEETAEADAVPSETLPDTPEHNEEDVSEPNARFGDLDDHVPESAVFENEEGASPENPDERPHPAASFRRELDPTIADVLRAEAEREAEARRKEGATLMESQPDLGLPDPSDDPAERRAREAQERMAKMRGYSSAEDEEEELYASTETAGSSRRELLPDIEEINSTLRSNSDRSPDVDPGQTAQAEAREKKSSRKGFTLTVALFALGTVLYVFAAQLSESVPQLAPMLESYATLIDGARGWLDTQMSHLLVWLDETAANSGQ